MRRPDGRVDPFRRTITELNVASRGGKKGAKRITVSLRGQRLKAYQAGTEIFHFNCTTGDAQHPTPPGMFRIYRKHEKYVSRTYNLPMDHAMFFYKGYVIHEAAGVVLAAILRRSGMLGVGSHGCVRLSPANAMVLFRWAPRGTLVEITAS